MRHLIATLVLLSVSAHARGLFFSHRKMPGECEILLTQVQGLVGLVSQTEPVRFASVRVIEERPGRRGGKIFVIERIGEIWESYYREHRSDPQGDPRTFIMIFGVEAARFMGFEMLSETRMTVPDADEFNAALDAINTVITDPNLRILLRFVNAPADQPIVASEAYLRLVSQWKLPIATSLSTRFHDWDYHGPNILIPNPVIEWTGYVAKTEVEFYEMLESSAEQDPQLMVFRDEFGKGFLDAAVKNIDFQYGNLTLHLHHAIKENLLNLRMLHQQASKSLINLTNNYGSQYTKYSAILELIPVMDEGSMGSRIRAKALLQEFLREKSVSDPRFYEVFHLVRPPRWSLQYPEYPVKVSRKRKQQLKADSDELCQFMQRRRLAIIEAVRILESH
jgi:hypothetical protein